MIATIALSSMPIAGALWRRALGGWGPLRRSILVALAPIPCLPLLTVLDPAQVAIAIVATYAHFLPPHHDFIDMGRGEEGSLVEDFSGMALRYMTGPVVLGMAVFMELFPPFHFPEAFLIGLCGLVTASGYALAWEAHDGGLLPAWCEPTAIGECVMGAVWFGALAIAGGTA